jgi:Glycosyl hydrolase family 62
LPHEYEGFVVKFSIGEDGYRMNAWSSILQKALLAFLCLSLSAFGQSSQPTEQLFSWTVGPALVSPRNIDGITGISIKDPTVVRLDDRWHVFCTMRGIERSHSIIYASFASWDKANEARWQILPNHAGYFCAPQVFYFTPHRRWYLICQASSNQWQPEYQPAFATNDNITNLSGWSALQPMFGSKPDVVTAWLDFWVICDSKTAYMFYTSLDGQMWRCQTPLEQFPKGWSTPVVALRGDIFEASHTYYVTDLKKYLTMIEAQNGDGWRYFKAYTAEQLDGEWAEIAATREQPMASMKNVVHPNPRWTDVVSHGEIVRKGIDEKLEISSKNMEVIFQGVLEQQRQGKEYGQIPWSLGRLQNTKNPF